MNHSGIPELAQNQFDALVSLCYNIGISAFGSSTLLKHARLDVNMPELREEFEKWCNIKGKRNDGLLLKNYSTFVR